MNELVERLRRAAEVADTWDPDLNPPLTDWSGLMVEAADALESLEEETEEGQLSLTDDLAKVLSQMVVGWKPMLGVDLSEHPEVQRVMARYRTSREIDWWVGDKEEEVEIND